MKVKKIYLKPGCAFSSFIAEWSSGQGIETIDHDFKIGDQIADGLLVINENQDIDKDTYDVHTFFDVKHLPTQKIDVNGTLQVAVSNFDMWLRNYKCKNILILGSDDLLKNDNLKRFLSRIEEKKVNA